MTLWSRRPLHRITRSSTRSYSSWVLLLCLTLVLPAVAQDNVTVKVTSESAGRGKPVTLQYKFQPGEIVRVKVVQLVSSENKIQGTAQQAQSRSISIKKWHIKDVDAEGNITFVHFVEKAQMWQHVEGRQQVTYDSEKDERPHPLYETVASTVGVPLATVTIRPHGLVKDRKESKPQFNPGLGELTVILPGKPIKAGQQWYVPQRLRFKLKTGQFRTIQTRQLFTLDEVDGDIAHISMKTQILTPIKDPWIEYQLVQRKQTGKIKFDMRRGRVISKRLDMDEVVTGFNGPTSRMQYLARFTEDLVEGNGDGRTAAKTTETKKK